MSEVITMQAEIPGESFPVDELEKLDAYWRAVNYLSVRQIYLYDNPLLKEPLKADHVKPRLLGWGTTPGLNFIYAHLNRLIKRHDCNVVYVTGPGHGGLSGGHVTYCVRTDIIQTAKIRNTDTLHSKDAPDTPTAPMPC